MWSQAFGASTTPEHAIDTFETVYFKPELDAVARYNVVVLKEGVSIFLHLWGNVMIFWPKGKL